MGLAIAEISTIDEVVVRASRTSTTPQSLRRRRERCIADHLFNAVATYSS